MKSGSILYLFAGILLAVFLLTVPVSCNKKEKPVVVVDEGPLNPDKADQLKMFAGRNRARLTWLSGTDKTVIKYQVSWTINGIKHTEDVPLTQPGIQQTLSLMITGLPEGILAFNVIAYNGKGKSSGISDVYGTIYGASYEAALTNRQVEKKSLKNGIVLINWQTPEKGTIGTELIYKNNSGDSVKRFISIDSLSTTLFDYSRENVIQYRTWYLPEQEVLDTFYSPLARMPFYETVTDGNMYLDMELFTKKIEEKFEGHVTKYSYDIRYKSTVIANAKGPNRTAYDPPASEFTVNDRFNPASVTKAVVGIALLRALEKNNISYNASIAGYLPSYWQQHSSIAAISFREVLNHTSGFRNVQGYNSEACERLIEKGVVPANKVYAYENVNYALARVLLVYVIGFSETGVPATDYQNVSTAFTNYINSELLIPVGIKPTSFKPDVNGSLFYAYPAGTMNGTNYGDWTLQEGSAGLQISTSELGTILQNLYVPDVYLSGQMCKDMELYGMALAKGAVTLHGGQAYQKSGSFPGSSNRGANLSTLLLRFGNGVQAFIMANGGEFGAGKVLLDSYNESWVPK